jgi:DNA-binding transcriptional LysR family regulator
VRAGDADIGLRYFDDASPDLVSEMLAPETLVVACARTHAMAGKSVRSLTALRGETWFAFPLNPTRREAAAMHIHAQFLVRSVGELHWTAVDSLTAQKRLVEAGFGLALLPASSIKEELAAKALATIRVGDLKAVNPVALLVRRGGYLNAVSQRLLEMLRKSPLSR